jgi:hypothetical protein
MSEAVAAREGQALEVFTPSPVFRGASMVKALADYRELQVALDGAMPDQLMAIAGRSFRKKGYWRAVSVAFNLSVDPVNEERAVLGQLSDGSDNYVYSVTYRATAPNGRSAVGDGTCAASEKQKGRMEATEHNVRSHAHTRAYNRSVSNLVGFGEVSAEEVERDEHEPAQSVKPARADGASLVAGVETKTGTGKTGKPWTMYQVSFEDGRSGSTFDSKLAKQAEQAKADGELLIPTVEQKGQYSNLTGLVSAGAVASQETAGEANGGGGDAVIADAFRKRFWTTANTLKWTEDEVQALLVEEGCLDGEGMPSAAHIKRKDFDRVLERVKLGKKVAE